MGMLLLRQWIRAHILHHAELRTCDMQMIAEHLSLKGAISEKLLKRPLLMIQRTPQYKDNWNRYLLQEDPYLMMVCLQTLPSMQMCLMNRQVMASSKHSKHSIHMKYWEPMTDRQNFQNMGLQA